MASFQEYLAQRKDKNIFSLIAIADFFDTLPDNREKVDFLMNLQRYVYESERKSYTGIDAKDASTIFNKEVLEYIETEKRLIENEEYFTIVDNENNAEVILSRREFSIFYYFLRKTKGSRNLTNNKLSVLISELSGYSRQNLRIDLSEINMEILLNETDTEKLDNLLTQILSEIRANRNKKL